MIEGLDVQTARIEERVIALTDEVKQYHAAIHADVASLKKTTGRHAEDIAAMKRNWWWVFTIVGALLSGGVAIAAALLAK